MRYRWLIFWIVSLTLVTALIGCNGSHRYDSRLTAADSLMQVDPDSALALVMAVSPDSLTGEGDRAYRDLLLTQARYKCYIVATSDSDINRALAYYRIHSSEREKLTRAYIYKGAVMEELGHPDSAMLYYKNAEATADAQDYVNLGQINIRIADLYRRYNADSEVGFEKYRQALHYYQLTGNKRLQQNCFFNMANCSADSAVANYRHYYQNAYNLAVEINDSAAIYACQEFLCRHLYMIDSTHKEAKQVALDCINHYRRYVHQNTYIDLAFIYVYENRPDSARYYLDVVDVTHEAEQVKMRYYWALSLLYKNIGDTVKSNYYSGMKSLIADSIDNNRIKNHIQNIENDGNKSQASNKLNKINKLRVSLWAVSLMTLIAIVSGGLYYYYRRRYYRSIIKEMELMGNTSDGNAHVDEHKKLLQQIGNKDSVLGQFVQNMVTFMHTSIDISERDTPTVIRRRIRETISDIVTDEFWNELRAHLDRNHNNLISDIASNPKISEIDLKFIELTCCGFDYLEIAVTLKISPKYVSTKRKMIERKLHLKVPLQEYLTACMKST